MISTSDIERDFLLGFIKIHVLHHAGEGPVYGTAIIEELSHHGYRVGPSLIYPLLHQLEVQGYLSRTDQSVSGKVRKYYVLTPSGAEALDDIKEKIGELVAEVIDPGAPVSWRSSQPKFQKNEAVTLGERDENSGGTRGG